MPVTMLSDTLPRVSQGSRRHTVGLDSDKTAALSKHTTKGPNLTTTSFSRQVTTLVPQAAAARLSPEFRVAPSQLESAVTQVAEEVRHASEDLERDVWIQV